MTLTELAAIELPPTITVEMAAELLGISRAAAYRAVHKGQIPSLRIGRRLLVPSARLLDILGLDPTATNAATTHRGDHEAPTLTPADLRPAPTAGPLY